MVLAVEPGPGIRTLTKNIMSEVKTKKQTSKPALEWTGYASDDEVREFMEAHNADEVGEGENAIDFAEAETLLANEDEWHYRWQDFLEAVTELMQGREYWRDDASDMGWMKRTGYKVFKATTREEFIRAISPNTDCTYAFHKAGKGLKVRIGHHDAPMGEHHVIKSITAEQYEADAE